MAASGGNTRAVVIFVLVLLAVVLAAPIVVAIAVIVGLTVLGAQLDSTFAEVEAQVRADAIAAEARPSLEGDVPTRVAAVIGLEGPPAAKLASSRISAFAVEQVWTVEGDGTAAFESAVAQAEAIGYSTSRQSTSSSTSTANLQRGAEQLDVTLAGTFSPATLTVTKSGRDAWGPVAPSIVGEDVPSELAAVAPPGNAELVGISVGEMEVVATWSTPADVPTLLAHLQTAAPAAGWGASYDQESDGYTSFAASRDRETLIVLLAPRGSGSHYRAAITRR